MLKNKLTWLINNGKATGNSSSTPLKGDASISELPDGSFNLPLYELLVDCRWIENNLTTLGERVALKENSPPPPHKHILTDVLNQGSLVTYSAGGYGLVVRDDHEHKSTYLTKEYLGSYSKEPLITMNNVIANDKGLKLKLEPLSLKTFNSSGTPLGNFTARSILFANKPLGGTLGLITKTLLVIFDGDAFMHPSYNFNEYNYNEYVKIEANTQIIIPKNWYVSVYNSRVVNFNIMGIFEVL